MKFALAQLNPRIGDTKANLEKISKSIESASQKGARVIIFPELSITGYPPADLLTYDAVVDENLKALESLKALSANIAVVVGYVERNLNNTGKPFFNSVAVFDKQKHVANYQKQLLPYYDIFDEQRYFEQGSRPCIVQIDGCQIGLTICEDIWNRNGFIDRPYSADPIEYFRKNRVDYLVNLSASPFHFGKPELRDKLCSLIAAEIQSTFVFCNQVGANDGLLFDGGSFVMDQRGQKVAAADFFKEALLIYDSQSNMKPITAEKKIRADWMCEALSVGIHDYVKKSGLSKVCLGLSGGIDSAVVACLAVKALGKDNVLGLILPSKYSSKETMRDARTLASNLGIKTTEFSIDSAFNDVKSELGKEFQKGLHSLTQENIQPRLRMVYLMAFSNQTGSLLLNTSNKSEIATGFATLYGDSSGALGVLGDLVKEEVYELAKWFNRNSEVIPGEVLTRPPSAELKENQTDQDVLPPYSELDCFVKTVVEDKKSPGTGKYAETFSRLHALSEYKRSQMPPVLRVSKKAFGSGRRIPIVSRKPTDFIV